MIFNYIFRLNLNYHKCNSFALHLLKIILISSPHDTPSNAIIKFYSKLLIINGNGNDFPIDVVSTVIDGSSINTHSALFTNGEKRMETWIVVVVEL